MSKKIIYISLFSLVLFACKKEIMTPNNARGVKDMNCIKPVPNQNNTNQGGFHDDGFGGGANAIGGGSNGGVYSGSPADTNSITDPNDDDDEAGKVGRGVVVGGNVPSGGDGGGTNTNPVADQNGN